MRRKYIIFNSKNKKIQTEEKFNFLEGTFSNKDYLSPSYINLNNPKYIEIDNMFFSVILVTNYNREQSELILKSLIDTNININISIFYEKQDSYKTIRNLTYHIGNVGVDLKGKNQNRQDIDIAAFTYNDAKYIRKEMQVNNEDLYFLYIYVNTFSTDEKELEYLLNKIEGILQSKGMQTIRAYFRQEQGFKSILPLMDNNTDVKEASKRNILTSGLVATYPFISSAIFDETGIFIGTNIYNNSLVFIDRYDKINIKTQIYVFLEQAGAGKSFYTKLLILRCRLLGIEQYIIDPEREYNNLCKNLNGLLLKLGHSSDSYINIFDIREESLEEGEQGYLANKISKLIGFFNLIFGNINEEEKALLEEKLIEVYKIKGITFDDSTLYKNNKDKINIKPVFKDTYDMPILEDFYNILNDSKTKIFKTKLIPFVKGSLRFFNNYTNVVINNKLIVADIYELGEENLKYAMWVCIDLFWDLIKKDRKIKKSYLLRRNMEINRSNFK